MDRLTRCRVAVGSALGLTAPFSLGAPPLERLVPGPEIAPLRVATVERTPDGRIVLSGDWTDYSSLQVRSPLVDVPAFDNVGRPFGPFADFRVGTGYVLACAGEPDDGSRWFFGSTYHAPVVVEDIQAVRAQPCAPVDEIDAAFFWNPPQPARLILVFLMFEQVYRSNGTTCPDPRTFTPTCGSQGVAFDFGITAPSPVQLATRVVGLSNLNLRLPGTDDNGDGLVDGSYEAIIATDIGPNGVVVAQGPTQFMLWGTGDTTGEPRPGHNNPDSVVAASLPLPQPECYDFTFGVCPDPLGQAVAFGILVCPADLNHDGFVDGIDADGFANDFDAGSTAADLNGDGFIDGIDSDLFYNAFDQPCP